MTPPNPLIELAERVERLTRPCRETDALIWNYLNPPRIDPTVTLPDGFGDGPPIGFGFEPPAYTASLDAAMTLVPEGWFGGIPISRNSDAWLRASNDSPIVYGCGKTIVLKLISAILRARAASEAIPPWPVR